MLINQRPYNPTATHPRNDDLERDYGQANDDHPVATSFLDEL